MEGDNAKDESPFWRSYTAQRATSKTNIGRRSSGHARVFGQSHKPQRGSSSSALAAPDTPSDRRFGNWQAPRPRSPLRPEESSYGPLGTRGGAATASSLNQKSQRPHSASNQPRLLQMKASGSSKQGMMFLDSTHGQATGLLNININLSGPKDAENSRPPSGSTNRPRPKSASATRRESNTPTANRPPRPKSATASRAKQSLQHSPSKADLRRSSFAKSKSFGPDDTDPKIRRHSAHPMLSSHHASGSQTARLHHSSPRNCSSNNQAESNQMSSKSPRKKTSMSTRPSSQAALVRSLQSSEREIRSNGERRGPTQEKGPESSPRDAQGPWMMTGSGTNGSLNPQKPFIQVDLRNLAAQNVATSDSDHMSEVNSGRRGTQRSSKKQGWWMTRPGYVEDPTEMIKKSDRLHRMRRKKQDQNRPYQFDSLKGGSDARTAPKGRITKKDVAPKISSSEFKAVALEPQGEMTGLYNVNHWMTNDILEYKDDPAFRHLSSKWIGPDGKAKFYYPGEQDPLYSSFAPDNIYRPPKLELTKKVKTKSVIAAETAQQALARRTIPKQKGCLQFLKGSMEDTLCAPEFRAQESGSMEEGCDGFRPSEESLRREQGIKVTTFKLPTTQQGWGRSASNDRRSLASSPKSGGVLISRGSPSSSASKKVNGEAKMSRAKLASVSTKASTAMKKGPQVRTGGFNFLNDEQNFNNTVTTFDMSNLSSAIS